MLAEQLKKSILQAAIQGKLTDQRKEDGSAQDLYNQIQEEKQRLINEKKIKKTKSLPVITEDEIPFEIPENWMWVRLGDVIKVSSGDSLPARAMKKGIVPVFGGNGITGYHNSFNVEKETIVIGRVGFYCGSIHITPDRAWVTDNAFITNYSESNICQQYLFYALKFMKLGDKASSTAQPVVSGRKIYPRLFPLPPLAEQKRIADTIQKYLAEIEQLEKDEEALAELQKAFPGKMKASILQQAIQGKLTDQRKEDGNAQDLYNQIREEKQKLIKEKKIKKEKTLPEITPEEIPFKIPGNWMWVRLGEVVKPEVSKEPNESFTYIDIASINNKLNTIQNAKYLNIEKDKIPSRAKTVAEPGDIVFSKVRPYLRNIAIIPEKGDEVPLIASTGFVVLRAFTGIAYRYLFYVSISSYLVNSMTQLMKGDNSPSCKKSDVLNCPIPLPPLAEQKRIVEKLDKLLPLCEA